MLWGGWKNNQFWRLLRIPNCPKSSLTIFLARKLVDWWLLHYLPHVLDPSVIHDTIRWVWVLTDELKARVTASLPRSEPSYSLSLSIKWIETNFCLFPISFLGLRIFGLSHKIWMPAEYIIKRSTVSMLIFVSHNFKVHCSVSWREEVMQFNCFGIRYQYITYSGHSHGWCPGRQVIYILLPPNQLPISPAISSNHTTILSGDNHLTAPMIKKGLLWSSINLKYLSFPSTQVISKHWQWPVRQYCKNIPLIWSDWANIG